jgi:hypothetical protein
MSLVVDDSFLSLILTKLNHAFKRFYYLVPAVISWKNRLKIRFIHVVHNERASSFSLLNDSLNFFNFFRLILFGKKLALLVGKEILIGKQLFNDLGDKTFWGHRLILHQLDNQIFFKLVN